MLATMSGEKEQQIFGREGLHSLSAQFNGL